MTGIETILGKGMSVEIPTPLGYMTHIVRKNKYKLELKEGYEVWCKSPNQTAAREPHIRSAP